MTRRAHAAVGGRHRARTRCSASVGAVGLLVLGIALAAGVAIERSYSSPPERTLPADTPGDYAAPTVITEPQSPRPPDFPDVTSPATTKPTSPSPERPERELIPSSGPGTFDVVDGGGSSEDPSALSYTVEIERGLPFSPRSTASIVDDTLRDDRGWIAVRGTTFRRVDSGQDLRILVASPDTTDRLCAPLATRGRVSCRNGALVVLNARRWAFGVPHYRSYLTSYRRYLVNHEVGHVLGEAHVSCPGPREPAPVMLQQTYSLEGCRRNPWPEVA